MNGRQQEESLGIMPGAWSGERLTRAVWSLLRAEDWREVSKFDYQYNWIRFAIEELPEDMGTVAAVDELLPAHSKERILPVFALRLAREQKYEYGRELLQYADCLIGTGTASMRAVDALPQAAWAVWHDQRQFPKTQI